MAAVELCAVRKCWGDAAAVDGVSLQVEQGTLVALLGPSGCGKSTTLRLIAGLEQADAGQVRIAGRDVTHLPSAQRGVAMVFQNYALFPHLTVAQNIVFGLQVRRVPRAECAQRLAQAAELLGLQALLERKPAQLSGGQRQRVALARAIVAQARVCLMDEPLSNLDPPHQTDWLHTMRALVDAGGTVVSVLHEVSLALQADDMVVMAAGRVLHQGACGAPDTHAALEQVFDHRIHVRHLDGMWMALPSIHRHNKTREIDA